MADSAAIDRAKLIVMLGDVIDRGPDSAGVLDHLCKPPPAGFHRVCLRGNHEDTFLALLREPTWSGAWLDMGGRETMRSYGFEPDGPGRNSRHERDRMMAEFVDSVPPRHRRFLENLPLTVETPRYFFVHAGVRPGVALDRQATLDLLSIRKGFVDHAGPPLAKTIVHGHTPALEPFVSSWRIGVDTGAYLGGPLSAVRLTRQGVAVIATD